MFDQGEILLIPVPFSDLSSVIKVDKVYTLETGIAIKKIGKLSKDVLLEVYNEFLKLISP